MKEALVIGSGSYVVGDSFGDGVILPSLLELLRCGSISKIRIGVRTSRDEEFWKRVEALKKTLGTSDPVEEFVFSNLQDIASGLDLTNTIAFISIPDDVHAEYIEFFLEKQVPTWVVKPLTGDGQVSRRLAAQAKASQTPLWVDYHKRFDESNLKLKNIVQDREHGSMLMYSVQYSQPSAIPLQDLKAWSKWVDVFQYIGCHYVDQVFFLHPEAVAERVSATGLGSSLHHKDGPLYDIVHALVDFRLPSGERVRGDFNIAWNDPAGSSSKSHQRAEAQFENGRVIANQKRRGFEIWGNDKVDDVNPYFFQYYIDPVSEGIRRPSGYGFKSILNFVRCLDQPTSLDSRLLPWAWNTFQTDLVIDAASLSLQNNGSWQAVEKPSDTSSS